MKPLIYCILLLFFVSCKQKEETNVIASNYTEPKTFAEKLSKAAISIINPSIDYDPSYFKIDYPNGVIPKGKGVCTDVVIRAYRILELQPAKNRLMENGI